MTAALTPRSLVRWEGFALHVDLDMLEQLANREIARRVPMVRDLSVTGDDEELLLAATVVWHGVSLRGAVRVHELRLHRRFFGCRLEAARGPLGTPLPVGLLGTLAQKYGEGLVHFDSSDRILLVDLRRFIPVGIELRIARVSCLGRWLTIQLAPGSLAPTLASVRPGEGE